MIPLVQVGKTTGAENEKSVSTEKERVSVSNA
jgi:hypothetical protein